MTSNLEQKQSPLERFFDTIETDECVEHCKSGCKWPIWSVAAATGIFGPKCTRATFEQLDAFRKKLEPFVTHHSSCVDYKVSKINESKTLSLCIVGYVSFNSFMMSIYKSRVKILEETGLVDPTIEMVNPIDQ
jgi:hypothetical protein